MSDEAVARPSHGARLQARLATAGGTGAEYDVVVADSSASFGARARVAEADGAVSFHPWSAEPPAWLVEGARVLLRGAWQRRRSGQPWPRRLARWRPAPESSA